MNDPYSQQPYQPYGQKQEPEYQAPSFGFGNEGRSQIRVKRVVFAPTGEYNDQYRRPWVTEYNRDNAEMVHDAVARTYHQYQSQVQAGVLPADKPYEVTPEMLSGVSSSFILPSATAERVAHINAHGGWGMQTGRFMIELEVHRPGAITPAEYLLIGYTDHLGITASAAIDPRMVLNINTMFEVRSVQVPTAMGTYTWTRQLNKVNQILVDDNYTGDINTGQSIRMRPMELMGAIQTAGMPELQGQNVTFVDSRVTNTSVPVLSNHNHTNPNNYMASVLGGLVSGKTNAHLQGRAGVHAYHLAANIVADSNPMRDPFLRALRNQNEGSLSNKFQWRDLLALDPNAEHDEICVVQYRDAPRRVSMNRPGEDYHVAGSTSGWHGSDRSTQVATMIANIVPTLMMDLALRSIVIYAGNVAGGLPVCLANNPQGLLGDVDMTAQAIAIQQMFQMQVVNAISPNNQIRFEVNVTANLFGEIWIKLHLEGDHPYDYVVPAYASSVMSPVMTTRKDTLDNLATAFHSLQNHALPVVHEPIPSSIGFFGGASSVTGNMY